MVMINENEANKTLLKRGNSARNIPQGKIKSFRVKKIDDERTRNVQGHSIRAARE